MINENWLLSYKDINGLEKSLERISWRFSKSIHPLLNPIDELIRNYENLEIDFRKFFPEIIEYANELKALTKDH